jgi:hypothetical protein
MNSIEEKLWNYIDGSCTADEQKAIALLIENDDVYRNKYNELLTLNNEFNIMELEEPSMAFTYNVMETIRSENARQPLKAAINNRIIWGIATFFMITIAALVVFALSSVSWSSGETTSFKMPVQINLINVKNYFDGPVIKGFLFFDVVMGLFLLDTYLRRKNLAKGQ